MIGAENDCHAIETGHAVGVGPFERATVDEICERTLKRDLGVACVKDEIEILGDARRLYEILHVQVARERHADPVFGGRDSIEEYRVVQRAVPRDLESIERSKKKTPISENQLKPF